MKVVALAGGTGSAKLLRGISELDCRLTVVANVGDNFWLHGLYICPDIDIAMYTLAGLEDKKVGWGVSGDTHTVMNELAMLGAETWFTLGDRDLATHIMRTSLLGEGRSLTRVTADLCRRHGVATAILPATDSQVETHILTSGGEMHLQDFWVRHHGDPVVKGTVYRKFELSRPTPEVICAISQADRVVICPANPVTSIGPMLAIPGFTESLRRSSARVVALSPMKGSAPFSGPAGKLMRAARISHDSVGVARLYSGFLDAIVIDRGDRGMRDAIESLGVKCVLSDTEMAGHRAEKRLATELMDC